MIKTRNRGLTNPSPRVCPDCDRLLEDCTCGRPNAKTVPVALTLAVAGWTLRKRAGDLVDAAAQVLFMSMSAALVYTLYLAVQVR
jgi:hypothetical protein